MVSRSGSSTIFGCTHSGGRIRPLRDTRGLGVFIYSVKTPRRVEVSFGLPSGTRRNNVSLLTGPNGAGKTDVLASIAHVFHGHRRNTYGASVQWAKRTAIRVTESPLVADDVFERHERIHLVAQTFSPFSRFPSIRRLPPRFSTSIFAQSESSDEYACIGFNQASRIELAKLSFSIVQNAILRLSERPSTAKVAFDVLAELGFKDGIQLEYRASKFLSALAAIADDTNALDDVLENFRLTGDFIIGNSHFERKVLKRLRRELDNGGVNETAEYLRHAINMIEEHRAEAVWIKNRSLETYSFLAFQDRHKMSADFPFLQSFSVLARLELIEMIGCKLTPVASSPVDLRRASSGQQQMLCSIFGLAAALEDDSVVLIDEPELSLHPRWQMNFFRHLETALEVVTGCHVIVATHSALIAQAAATHGVDIISMGAEDLVTSKTGSSQRSHASVEELLVNVFGTPIPNSLHISKEIFGLVTKAESGTSTDRYEAIEQLRKYMSLYQRHGEGSHEMVALLDKALRLLTSASSVQA